MKIALFFILALSTTAWPDEFTIVSELDGKYFEIKDNRCIERKQPNQYIHSIIDYMTEIEQDALIKGDLSQDMTAAFQCAVDNGAQKLDLEDYKYRIDGTITLPNKGLLIFGNKWSIQRGPDVNNDAPLFTGHNINGAVKISGGSLKGNVNKGRRAVAAGISINGGVGVFIRNMEISGFAVGVFLNKINNLKIDNENFIHDNLITGVSAVGVSHVLLENSTITGNGDADPDPDKKGQTHDIYFINSTNGIVSNNTIGNSKDPNSYALFLRHDKDAEKSGISEVDNWKVYGNKFIRNGFRASIDPNPDLDVKERKPTKNVHVYSNRFSQGANLRFDDPVNGSSWGNIGLNKLIVSAASQYPENKLSYTSTMDECKEIQTSAILALKDKVKKSYIFKDPIALNGGDIPVKPIPGFGGYPSYTIIRSSPNVKKATIGFSKDRMKTDFNDR